MANEIYISRRKQYVKDSVRDLKLSDTNNLYLVDDMNNKIGNGIIIPMSDIEINIKQFGAKGDGISDDTQAIKDALNFADKNKIRKIIFSEGTYRVSETIFIPNSTSIYVSGLCKIVSTIKNGAILNFIVDSESNIRNTYLVQGPGKLYINSKSGRNSQYVIGVKISGTNYCNVHFTNTTMNNCYIGLQIESKNVWNITVENCIFFYNTWGYFYGQNPSQTSTTVNAGERICFKDCVFTQIDMVSNKLS